MSRDQKFQDKQKDLQKLQIEHSRLESNFTELDREKQQAERDRKRLTRDIDKQRATLYEKEHVKSRAKNQNYHQKKLRN